MQVNIKSTLLAIQSYSILRQARRLSLLPARRCRKCCRSICPTSWWGSIVHNCETCHVKTDRLVGKDKISRDHEDNDDADQLKFDV